MCRNPSPSYTRQRNGTVLAAAMRQVADDPEGPLTKKRTELRSGIRSFHLRYAPRSADAAKVRRPVHVLYYRVAQDGVIEIVRVLHEKMDPSRPLDEPSWKATSELASPANATTAADLSSRVDRERSARVVVNPSLRTTVVPAGRRTIRPRLYSPHVAARPSTADGVPRAKSRHRCLQEGR